MNRRVFSSKAAQGFDAGDSVLITGPQSDTSLKALYESALAHVYPSTYEGFGVPRLEAMACNGPVLASTAAPIPDVCGDAAIYFDPLNVAAMREATRRVLDDEAQRADLIARGTSRGRRVLLEPLRADSDERVWPRERLFYELSQVTRAIGPAIRC